MTLLLALILATTQPSDALAESQLECNRLRVVLAAKDAELADLKAELVTREKMHADALRWYVARVWDLESRLKRIVEVVAEK